MRRIRNWIKHKSEKDVNYATKVSARFSDEPVIAVGRLERSAA